jgi:aryl-alcohol dehydrogenase-like predicted oxidoreductase
MEYTNLGKSDLRVSRICFGTWAFGGGWGPFDVEQSKAAMRRALELGINFFDTAPAYGWGESERLLGDALKDEIKSRRSEVILATKCGLHMDGDTLVRDSSADSLRQGLIKSLKDLGTDYIDLYQVHWPDVKTPFSETAETLAKFVKEGLVRYVGVSNFNAQQMSEFEKTIKITSLQPPYHLFRREIEAEVLPFAKQNGIGVLVYGPLAHGLLTGKITPNYAFAPSDWRSQSSIFQGKKLLKNLNAVHKLVHIAERLNCTVTQLSVAWTLSHPAVDVAIVGARNAAQIEGSAPAAEIQLSSDILAEIDVIMSDSISIAGPSPESIEGV